MFRTIFRKPMTINKSDKLTLRKTIPLFGFALLCILMVACASPPAADVPATAVSPTAVPPTAVPPTAVPPTDTPPADGTLLEAVKADDVAQVQRLLEAGADPNLEEDGAYPMFVAVSKGYIEVVKLLVAHGGDIYMKLPANSTSLLEVADPGGQLTDGQVQVVEYLLEQQLADGWDVNQQDDYGVTLIGWAVEEDRYTLAERLIELGADLEIVDNYLMTELLVVANRGRVEQVRFLVDHGVNLDYQGRAGYSALHWAAESLQGGGSSSTLRDDKVEVVKILIEAGATLDLENESGKTPLDIAIENGYDEIAQLLREAGATE